MANPPDPDTRPNNLSGENDNLKSREDQAPPRPATEPDGAAASQDSPKTATDPGSGASDDRPPAPNAGPRRT